MPNFFIGAAAKSFFCIQCPLNYLVFELDRLNVKPIIVS